MASAGVEESAAPVMPNPVDCFAKSPLILSFSAQARLGVLASFAAAPASGCGRGEGTPELSRCGGSAGPSPSRIRLRMRRRRDGKLAKASLLGRGIG